MSLFEYLCQCGKTTEVRQKQHTKNHGCCYCGKKAKYTPSVNASMPDNWKV